MNAKELRERLAGIPDDTMVILSSDAEGNNYSPLADTTPPGQYHYEADCDWSGEIRDPDEETAPGKFYHDDETRAYIRSLPVCLVLWPTN